ncbi:MAG: zf-HC2 domain-containing protein [Planctomycetes bacterium]|nr:zf-HC2 domain-containing protein [Planctomycetota bacterium]
MIDCNQASELISAYVDDELDDDEEALLAEHLYLCPDCREMLDYERDAKEIVRRRHVQVRSPANVRSAIVDGIARASDRPFDCRARPPVVALLKPLLMPLVMILALLMGVLLAAMAVRDRLRPAEAVGTPQHREARTESAPPEAAPEPY